MNPRAASSACISDRDRLGSGLPATGKIFQTLFERDPRTPAKHFLRTRDIRKAVPDVSDSILAGNLGLKPGAPRARTVLVATSPTVIGIPLDMLKTSPAASGFQCKAACAGHVVDTYKIPHLPAVFEDQRWTAVQQSGCEITEHSCIRVRKSLIRTIGVEESKCYGRYVVGATYDETTSVPDRT